ncbi:MAG: glycosyltransferase [Candidatus Binatus sp.]|jgi:glycosyltransferase involved in cell wall biosynthesis|uniref:glycosyltransferase n=1 Tax=Candidatus Binatus sp. TaxID=2811406 RepID=UPI003D1459C3
MLTNSGPVQRVTPHGKFLARAGQKFFFKAMRLADVSATLEFAHKLKLRKRLDDLRASHTTGLVLTEANAQPCLDIAAQSGLVAMVELRITADELTSRRGWKSVVSRIAHTTNIFATHPALAGYILNCEIAPDALRAGGLENARRRLRGVVKTIKGRAPDAMVGIKVRPETRALSILEEDFLYAEIPALEPLEIRDFVVALHNLAEARPVVIEFRQASPGQDEAVAVAFGTGAAGVVAPPVPAPVSQDWLGVRMMRASDVMPFVTLNGTCPPRPPKTPMVSVVICAYDAERTMRDCLESLRRLDYPNFEVVIVDDGSRDRTADISMDFPEFRLIRQPNKGLGVARNVGMHAARGEIIAYTDSDCVVDPHWLTLMVRLMIENNFDGCGGPNYAPHEDGWIEASCAASPGAPCHVLVAEDRAEHLAGCNMLFSKAALAKIGGFDPQFTSAGDDVDICWRLLDAGFKLGFSPAAFVWHFRRNTVKAYYGQQRGYGRAEAMLYPRYPERFNVMGQIAWRGTIPGLARTIPGGSRKRVLWNATAGAQTIFDPALTLARVLPQTLEWTVLSAIAIAASIVLGVSIIPAAAMLALGPIWALYYAWHAPLEKSHQSFTARLLIAYLAYTGPMVRTMTRYKTRAKALTGLAGADGVRQRPTINWLRRSIRLDYWNDESITRDRLMDRMLKLFARSGHGAVVDAGWNDYDLEVRPNPWTRIELKTADEEHEAGKVTNRVLVRIKSTRITKLALAAGVISAAVAAIAGLPEIALGLGALTMAGAVCIIAEMVEAGRVAHRATEQCATELNLAPLGVLIRQPSTAEATASARKPARAQLASRDRIAE